jgi:hypothetical protein
MAAAGSMSIATVTAHTGNRCTVTGSSSTGNAAAGFVPATALIAQWCSLVVRGDIHGILRFPFADPETLEGMLMPADLKNAEIEIVEGGAGAEMGLIVEELHTY